MDPITDSNSSPVPMVCEFHKAFELPVGDARLDKKNLELLNLRMELVKEEALEVHEAFEELYAVIWKNNNLEAFYKAQENMMKELADLIYVCYGFAVVFGWDLSEVFRRVHASNMTKLGENGEPDKDKFGKCIKGPNYIPPVLTDLVIKDEAPTNVE
jgi:predicted HAD superfamily Cof-like phosphohydrolase